MLLQYYQYTILLQYFRCKHVLHWKISQNSSTINLRYISSLTNIYQDHYETLIQCSTLHLYHWDHQTHIRVNSGLLFPIWPWSHTCVCMCACGVQWFGVHTVVVLCDVARCVVMWCGLVYIRWCAVVRWWITVTDRKSPLSSPLYMNFLLQSPINEEFFHSTLHNARWPL